MLKLRTLPLALTLALVLLSTAATGLLNGRAEAAPAEAVWTGEFRCEASGRVEIDLYWQPSGHGPQWIDFSSFDNNFASGTFAGAGPLGASQSSATYSLVAGAPHYVRINTLTSSGWQPGPTIAFTTPACGGAPAPAGSVTLSFDDHADPHRVNGILDTLSAHGVKAVFCITGNWARAHTGAVERIANQGHTLCNHTASHAMLTQLSDEDIRAEILGGVQSHLLRPPFGAYDARVAGIAASLGYQLYLWSIDPRDWDGRPPESIVNTILSNLHHGAVVLLHLHAPSTYDVLPEIISSIREQGYQLN